uniref:Thyrotropin subunit beta n=1 Tax=Scleropages formosus TaxID=113540 RepID=A0A8C9UXJ1_SCLFO
MQLNGILCLMMIWAVFACAPKNYTLYVQRLHCDRCVAINTTVCSGFCYSQDTNLRGQMGRWQPYQRGCTYQMLAYQTAVLPGCQLNVDSLYSYPAALSCHCARCDTASSDCIHKVKDITRANTSKHLQETPHRLSRIQTYARTARVL